MRKKPYIHSIATLSLSVLLLLASSGLSLNRMVCLFTGTTFISLQPIPECMPKDVNAMEFNAKCCDFSQVTMNLEFDADRSHQQVIDHAACAGVMVTHHIQSPVSTIDTYCFGYADLPPPQPLSRSLALRQTYLI